MSYYNSNLLFSYNKDIMCVMDLRGYGKTTHFMKKCFDLATRHKKCMFAWFRRTRTEYDELINSKTFGQDIQRLFPEVLRGYEVNVIGNNIWFEKTYPNGKVDRFIGGILSYYGRFKSKKGIAYPYIQLVVVDEALPEDGKFMKGEYNILLSLLDSIFRKRRVRCVLLSNTATVVNPYFENWKIHKLEEGFTVVKNKSIVIEYGTPNSKVFSEERKKTSIGQLIEDTEYGEYATDGKFLLDDPSDVEPVIPKGRQDYLHNISCNGRLISTCLVNGILYFGTAKDKTRKCVSPYVDDAKGGKAMFADKSHPFLKLVRKQFMHGLCLFENQMIKNEIVLIVRKMVRGF